MQCKVYRSVGKKKNYEIAWNPPVNVDNVVIVIGIVSGAV